MGHSREEVSPLLSEAVAKSPGTTEWSLAMLGTMSAVGVLMCVQVGGSMLGRTENLSKEDIPREDAAKPYWRVRGMTGTGCWQWGAVQPALWGALSQYNNTVICGNATYPRPASLKMATGESNIWAKRGVI